MTVALAVVAAFILGSIAMLQPFLLAAPVMAEQWPFAAFAPEGVFGPAVIAASLFAAAGALLFVRHDPIHLGRGHLAMLVVLVIASWRTYSVLAELQALETPVARELLLTVGTGVPMLVLAITVARSNSAKAALLPLLLAYTTALLPVLLLAGVVGRSSFNPLTIGHVSWMAIVLLVAERNRIPNLLFVPLLVISALEWLTAVSTGPRIAGAVALVVLAWKSAPGEWVTGVLTVRPGVRTPLVFVSVLAAAAVATFGVTQALTELARQSSTNASVREAAWRIAWSEATLTGRGARPITGIDFGEAFEIQPHNFFVDALVAAGLLGLGLMVYAVWKAWQGLRDSNHVLLPYCAGIVVANLFSGGLFRWPTLWFALGFLIALHDLHQRDAAAEARRPRRDVPVT